jgi:microcin C transport system substrate-binding protein
MADAGGNPKKRHNRGESVRGGNSALERHSRMAITRRRAVQLSTAALGGLALPGPARLLAADGEIETHGLSTFGELGQPPDFKNFGYVNPTAPKGGALIVQIKNTSGNQNFDTFDTFNIYVFKGDGAAGMDATFDTLMAGTADEPSTMYGLVAKSVRISADKLTYKFVLRPEAKFHDGSRLSAKDVAWSLNTLKEKGHPIYRSILGDMAGAEAEGDDVCVVKFTPERSRDAHLIAAGMPIFSASYYATREFDASTLEAPLASGPYKLARYEQGRFVEFERVKDYWAAKLPVNVGTNNFDRIRYEYYRERQIAFEDFKAGKLNYNEEYTARFWATQYDFPAIREGHVKREELPTGTPRGTQGWFFNTRRPQFKDPRVREAINYCFDFEWTSKNIMYSAYTRLHSYFQGGEMEAKGKPGPDELALLEPFRGQVPDEVFGEPWMPPVSDGSGSDRNLLRKADELFRAAGCKRDGSRLLLPDGKPLTVEFLDSSPTLQPHTQPFIANLRKLGVDATARIVDTVQYKRRTDSFDFDVASVALGGSLTPGVELQNVYGSKAAKTDGTRNMAGVADPAVDLLLTKIANAKTRVELDIACRSLDRVLRAGRYWIPMWVSEKSRIAYWDIFSRPSQTPKFGTGAPATWWHDADKAKKINWQG